MVALDLKASLKAFLYSTSRLPRLVVPYVWDASHTAALGVDRAISVEVHRPKAGELLYAPNPPPTTSDHELPDLPFSKPPMDANKLSRVTAKTLGMFPVGSDGIRSFVGSKSSLLDFCGEVACQNVLTTFRNGYGLFLYPAGTIIREDWYLDGNKTSDNRWTTGLKFQCMGWRAKVDVSGIMDLIERGSDSPQIRGPVLAWVSTDVIKRKRADLANARSSFWKNRSDYGSVKRLIKGAMLEEKARRGRLDSNPLLNWQDLDPVVFAALIALGQAQMAATPSRDYYTVTILTSRSNGTDASRSAVDIITITGRFSKSYLRNMENVKFPDENKAYSDEVDIKVGVVEFYPASAPAGDDGLRLVLHNFYFLSHHIASLIAESARDLGMSYADMQAEPASDASVSVDTPLKSSQIQRQPSQLITPQPTPSPPTIKKRAADEMGSSGSHSQKRMKPSPATSTATTSPPRPKATARPYLRRNSIKQPLAEATVSTNQQAEIKAHQPPPSNTQTRSSTKKRRALEDIDLNSTLDGALVKRVKTAVQSCLSSKCSRVLNA